MNYFHVFTAPGMASDWRLRVAHESIFTQRRLEETVPSERAFSRSARARVESIEVPGENLPST